MVGDAQEHIWCKFLSIETILSNHHCGCSKDAPKPCCVLFEKCFVNFFHLEKKIKMKDVINDIMQTQERNRKKNYMEISCKRSSCEFINFFN